MSHEPTDPASPRPAHRPWRAAARILAAAGLAVNAYVHADLAARYDPVSATISQGSLFRIETALAALAALLVLFWRRSLGDVVAWLTAAGGLTALLVHRYVDVGASGPLPDMYEPLWYTEKDLVVISQVVAVVAMTLLLVDRGRERLATWGSASGDWAISVPASAEIEGGRLKFFRAARLGNWSSAGFRGGMLLLDLVAVVVPKNFECLRRNIRSGGSASLFPVSFPGGAMIAATGVRTVRAPGTAPKEI
ncbi:hypothetical protein [Streptomyces sp. NPDC056105]|uniref:hypothetical protein n=1 Tax=Streptomyces sp. NPDC056105 TaxID=3345714 RepID=UPI0035E32E78